MATFYVKKDGSGSHTQIQSAIFDAQNGDVIEIEAGTFYENIDLYKSVTLKGAGRDLTVIEGKLTADTFAGCSWFAGEDVITMASTSGVVRGRSITGTNITANSRVSQIIDGTQIKLSLATISTGNFTRTASPVLGSYTVTLGGTGTNPVAGQKVSGPGVSGLVVSFNSTTKVMTLDSPVTASGTNVTLSFKVKRTGVTLTMASQFAGSQFPASIQLMNVATNGVVIKDMTVKGFDGNTNQEAAAISLNSPSSGVHQNWMIDNCRLIANGDQAIASSNNLSSNGGTVQNCIIEGKTFVGSQPAEVPAFSSFVRNGTITAVTGASFSIQYSDMSGIVVGGYATSLSHSGTATVSGVSGNIATYNKTSTAAVGQVVQMTITNVQYTVPNVARQLVTIGNSGSVSACLNTTFKNNTVTGQTGAVIGSNKNMFNTAITVDTVGGLIENNVINGTFGAGDPNTLVSNFAIRSRGAGVVVQNNVNNTKNGRGNSGFYIPLGTSVNNIELSMGISSVAQISGQQPVVSSDSSQVISISKVQSDPVFSNKNNWKLMTYIYKHKSSSKRLTVSFSSFNSGIEKKMKIRQGVVPGMEFELHKVIISDSNHNLMVVKRSEIDNPQDYDFTLA